MGNTPSKRRWNKCTGYVLCALLATIFSSVSVSSQQSDPVSFSGEILPLLRQNCFRCHGDGQQKSNLDLRTLTGTLRGGLHGPAVVPGNPKESRLYRRVAGLEDPNMPFGSDRLAEDDIELLRRWIDQGAEWDEGARELVAAPAAGDSTPEVEGTGTEDGTWWSFKKVIDHPVPEASSPRWNKNPIDAFVMESLHKKGLSPAPEADKHTLIRRSYLDLTGLLPSHEEVTAFVNDNSPGAFNRMVDRLLESPRYGERWGRHWLDVARYADSGGYEQDYDYVNAWRYRDYVIRAFNHDKPYNQFVLEQLAGDELDEVTHDSLIATGFHRVMATVGFREKDNPQYRYTYLNDMIATTSRGLMGLTVDCARCHNHKFDPIKQVEYYQMMATFFPFVKYDHPLAPPQEVAAYEARKDEVETRIEPLKERIGKIQEPYKALAFEKKLSTFPEEIQLAVGTPEEERTEGQKLLAAQILSTRGGGKIDELLSPEDKAEIEKIKEKIKEIEKELPDPLPVAMGIRDGDYRFAPDGQGDQVQPGKGNREFYDFEGTFLPQAGKRYVPPTAHMLPTGDYLNKGPEVEPGFLGVLTKGNPPEALPPSDGRISTGRRRALAEWLIDEDHPLTARVMVNRIWQHHFGRGLVNTPSNFGQMGQLPSHPKLLDWLAREFVRQGWSIKHLHRLIMNSEVYRMSSSYASKANAGIDPENIYLWRFRQHRLEAEGVRDIILATSGQLNLKAGGEPFFPPVPKKMWESFKKGRWVLNEENPEVWRRSVYAYGKRGMRYPMFEVLDLPDLNVTCERRNTTTVATQALTLLNNGFVVQQARYFADRVWQQAGPDPARQVKAAYRIALNREPRQDELDRNIAFLGQQGDQLQGAGASKPQLEALVDLCNVVFNLNEFIYIN